MQIERCLPVKSDENECGNFIRKTDSSDERKSLTVDAKTSERINRQVY